MHAAVPFLIAGAHALVTLLPLPRWEQPVYPTAAYLAGCEIAAYEDGSKTAYCPEDGAALVYDADGQPHVNAAGVPLRAPGHWYAVEGR